MDRNQKHVDIILHDGTSAGAWKCIFPEKTIVGFKIPRAMINKLKEDEFFKELDFPGVYVLYGRTNNKVAEKVYIGESEDVRNRLYQHKMGDGKQTGKAFWSTCLVFVTVDGTMQKAHTTFLEFKFYEETLSAKRYSVDNENKPHASTLTAAQKIDCEIFLEDCKLLSEIMGIPLFSNPLQSTAVRPDDVVYMIKSTKKNVNASGYILEHGDGKTMFVVLASSCIAKNAAKKTGISIKKLREKLKKKGIIDEEWKFTQDCCFKSPGIAASVVMGGNVSGMTLWTTDDDRSLQDLKNCGAAAEI